MYSIQFFFSRWWIYPLKNTSSSSVKPLEFSPSTVHHILVSLYNQTFPLVLQNQTYSLTGLLTSVIGVLLCQCFSKVVFLPVSIPFYTFLKFALLLVSTLLYTSALRHTTSFYSWCPFHLQCLIFLSYKNLPRLLFLSSSSHFSHSCCCFSVASLFLFTLFISKLQYRVFIPPLMFQFSSLIL